MNYVDNSSDFVNTIANLGSIVAGTISIVIDNFVKVNNFLDVYKGDSLDEKVVLGI